jgi:hypothetical protein
MNICPVCGYNRLEFPPVNYSICACCGTEFGYDDRVLTHAQLTMEWVNKGYPWFDEAENKPVGWNADMQLINGGFGWAVPKFVVGFQSQVNLTLGQAEVRLPLFGNDWQSRAA